jgi:arsenite-transporting ATPase
MNYLEQPTRNLFFTGKGGVGKTSLACATAVALADAGKRVLLVSTDPASNLDEVLGTSLNGSPTAVSGANNLFALNIDPAAAAAAYRERMVAPYRNVLPEAVVASMEEQFSGSCTLEIAAFDEFARLLGDPQATAEFDHVIFDTAPTGHTLRLLSLPSAWTGFLADNTTGTSCLGPLAGLQAQQALYERSVQALADGAQTTLVLVARPELATLDEAARTSGELLSLGMANQHLAINGVFRAAVADDPIARAFQERSDSALAQIPSQLAAFPRTLVPLAPHAPLGIAGLRAIGKASPATLESDDSHASSEVAENAALGDLIDELARSGRGVILTMGKGGVGKTTIAAAVAVALADRGFPVSLSTTDPAAHLAAAIETEIPNLRVGRIDPAAEVAAYSAEVMRTAGKDLDEAGRALLAEDLRSPCTEEIAVFRAFARTVDEGKDGFVVLDTAPTGHTILLLDAALAYHREVSRQAMHIPHEVETLLPRLRDPEFTRVLLVTLPEATPVHEAAQLQSDLRRAGIEPFAWVINQALTNQVLRDPVLRSRQRDQKAFIREVEEEFSRRTAIVGWQVQAPTGVAALRRLPEERSSALASH